VIAKPTLSQAIELYGISYESSVKGQLKAMPVAGHGLCFLVKDFEIQYFK
jgi:hypothetical protein